MEFKFTNANRNCKRVWSALFLAAIFCNMLATLDWLYLLPATLLGVLLPMFPITENRKVRFLLFGMLAVLTLFRFVSILDGMKLLANRMFDLSEQTQSYEYDYFSAVGESAVEAVLWLSILAGLLCSLWGNWCNAMLCGIWFFAMAYFGVTPDIVWFAVLLLAGLWNALPGQQKWFHGLIAAVLVAAIAVLIWKTAPEPSKTISALDDQLRDSLAASPVMYEQMPVPLEVPEPELIPPPSIRQEQPDHGVQRMAINILFFALAALTLMLLFIPAIIKDRAAKRRARNRAGIQSEDHAEAIRAMYLYAQRWRSLSDISGAIPKDVYAIWQEAAYSNHVMHAEQRALIYGYMRETAEGVWAESDWKKRLHIQYRIAL